MTPDTVKENERLEADLQELVQAWNSIGPPIPGIRKLTKKRRMAALARLREPGWFDDAIRVLKLLETSEFHRGGSRSGWRANFDWLVRPDSVVKAIERMEADR